MAKRKARLRKTIIDRFITTGVEGRGDKTAMRVQGARLQRDEGDEQKIGKGDAGQRDGEREFFRIGAKSRREKIDESGREGKGKGEQHNLR